ncbi:hypothetical protein B0H10DRAFT_1794425 [Mycena sp. CBHHK59/15]|nr:hypothetical protein B0H10DRAFT_1794425 [Mycena sp. CBHHK59/15]
MFLRHWQGSVYTVAALMNILGIASPFLRPPFGSYNHLVRQVAFQQNKSLVLWDLEYVVRNYISMIFSAQRDESALETHSMQRSRKARHI